MTSTATTNRQRGRHHGPPLKRKPLMETWADASPAERGDMALLLRAEGMTWSKIAAQLGYTTRSAAYTAAMRRALVHAPPTEAQRDAARRRQLEMLDEAFTGLVAPLLDSADATQRDIGIEQARKLIDRSVRILGVAPSQTPIAQRLPQWLEVRP